jgi:hypothetical protein
MPSARFTPRYSTCPAPVTSTVSFIVSLSLHSSYCSFECTLQSAKTSAKHVVVLLSAGCSPRKRFYHPALVIENFNWRCPIGTLKGTLSSCMLGTLSFPLKLVFIGLWYQWYVNVLLICSRWYYGEHMTIFAEPTDHLYSKRSHFANAKQINPCWNWMVLRLVSWISTRLVCIPGFPSDAVRLCTSHFLVMELSGLNRIVLNSSIAETRELPILVMKCCDSSLPYHSSSINHHHQTPFSCLYLSRSVLPLGGPVKQEGALNMLVDPVTDRTMFPSVRLTLDHRLCLWQCCLRPW